MIAHLRSVGEGINVEEELEKAQHIAGQNPHLARQLMAVRFYLRDAILECSHRWLGDSAGATNQALLVSRLETWRRSTSERIAYATFNYDLILETGLQTSLGRRITDMDSYLLASPVVKLHGSVNWAHPAGSRVEVSRIGPAAVPNALIDEAEAVVAGSDFIWLQDGETPVGPDGQPLLPAIAIPTREKQMFECPDQHLDALTRLLPEVDRLLIIGWNAADEHFLREWRERVTRPPVVGLIDAKATKDEAGALTRRISESMRIPTANFYVWRQGLSSFMRSPELLDAFLSRPTT